MSSVQPSSASTRRAIQVPPPIAKTTGATAANRPPGAKTLRRRHKVRQYLRQKAHTIKKSVVTVPNVIALLALLVGVIALYWAWVGTQTSVDIAMKEHLLHCREHYSAHDYQNEPIPPECSDAMRQLVPVTTMDEIASMAAPKKRSVWLPWWEHDQGPCTRNCQTHIIYDQSGDKDYLGWNMFDNTIAKCFNSTSRMLAPVAWDQVTDDYSYWLESGEGCLTFITQPGDARRPWKYVELYVEIPEGLYSWNKARYLDEDFLSFRASQEEIIGYMGTTNHFRIFRCGNCMDQKMWEGARRDRRAHNNDNQPPLSNINGFNFRRVRDWGWRELEEPPQRAKKFSYLQQSEMNT